MKIEKINENQIRCTLTRDDLNNRKINLSELSYGSEKARHLFYDMMQQANLQYGFEFNGTPLMIEAIPTTNCLILNITKVKDPEELDTRFSSFSSPPPAANAEMHITGADGVLNLLRKIKEMSEAISDPSRTVVETPRTPSKNNDQHKTPSKLVEAFRFTTLDDAIHAAKAVSPYINCKNSLYKYDADAYLLIVHGIPQESENFNRIFNILSEYSMSDRCSEASEKHFREHGYQMIANNAIQKLSAL